MIGWIGTKEAAAEAFLHAHKIFRPDGEMRIGDKLYLLEIDRGTEYLEAC
ncbi:hypothetical protein [Paenibacillus alginolyticus]|nr:hypothetical protein [Paenibacillus alginolyticus]MEC0144332.1 hypothetical protein [Paenibacillus alginolyticus]